MINIKIGNKINITKDHSETSETFIVTRITTEGEKDIQSIELQSQFAPIQHLSIDFNPYEFTKKYLNNNDEAEQPLTPTEKIRSNYKPENAPQETGQPPIERPITKDKI